MRGRKSAEIRGELPLKVGTDSTPRCRLTSASQVLRLPVAAFVADLNSMIPAKSCLGIVEHCHNQQVAARVARSFSLPPHSGLLAYCVLQKL